MALPLHLVALAISVIPAIADVLHSETDICRRGLLNIGKQNTCLRTPLVEGSEAVRQSGWQGPHECVDEYCIFSNQEVGDGIVLVTTIENAKLVADFPTISDLGSSTVGFDVASVPGKGIGLVANRAIPKGEHTMISPPAMMVQVDAHKDLSPEERSYLYDLAVEKLPPHGKEAFMQQMGDDVHVKLDKNGFGMHIGTDDSGGHIGGFSGASRMNHDCRPNVAYRITNITHITTAIRDIAPREELTISYINANLPRSERQERLSQWGFQCQCAHCSMGDVETEASDARVRLIAELETELDDPFSKKVTAETGAQLVALYEEERLDIYLGPAYTRAALNYGLFAEEKKAKEYAQKAIGALTRQSGPKAGDLPSLEALAQDPRSHWTWGKRKVVQIPVEDLNFA